MKIKLKDMLTDKWVLLQDLSNQDFLLWAAGNNYESGDYVKYNSDVYKCLFFHYSLPGWEPDNPELGAVWQKQ